MALLGPSPDYTDRDFDSLRRRLLNLVRSVYPSWSDTETAKFNNLLMEALAHVGDIIGKYLDNRTAEALWGRATQRRSLISHAKLIGFRPRSNTASQVDLEFRLTAAAAGKVTIPARTHVRTEAIVEPITFETMAEIIFQPGGVGPIIVTAENAELREELFTSTGLPNQELRTAGRPFLDDSLTLTSTTGTFEVVDNLLASTAADRHCTVVVDQEDRATIRLGNGISGAIPMGTLQAQYKVGGGAKGKVEPGKLKKLEGLFTDENGNTVVVTVTNPSASSLALNRQTLEQIRMLAPLTLRSLERSVAEEDFQNHALQVTGVARALMLTSDQTPMIEENRGILFIVPSGGGAPTLNLINSVLQKVTVEKPPTATFQVAVQSAAYLTVNVEATVYLQQGAVRAQVRRNIQEALEAAFAISFEDGTPNPEIDFGFNLVDEEGNPTGSIAWSDIYDFIKDTEGVRKLAAGDEGLKLNGEPEDLDIEPQQFPVLGTVTIIDGSTGTVIPLEEA